MTEKDAVRLGAQHPGAKHSSRAPRSPSVSASSSHTSARCGTTATASNTARPDGLEASDPRMDRVAHGLGHIAGPGGERLGDEERVAGGALEQLVGVEKDEAASSPTASRERPPSSSRVAPSPLDSSPSTIRSG